MTIETEIPRGPSRRFTFAILLAAGLVVAVILNRPLVERLETVRRELAEAGYQEARVDKRQTPKEMRRCDVNQIKEPGFAYAWKNGTHSGLYCLRLDGRPNEIIVD